MFLLEPLKSHDINFFIVCGAIVAIIAIVWLLIPVFNKSQYRDQRESLRKREIAFKSNLKQNASDNNVSNDTFVSNDTKENEDTIE